MDVAFRFWSKVDKSNLDGCWVWMAGKRPPPWNYGTFRVGQKMWTAHRWCYEHYVFSIPSGMHVLHHCDNPPCVRPGHLFLGTQADNLADMDAKGRRNVYDRRGRSNSNVRLACEDVDSIRRLYAEGGHTQTQLAMMYAVSQVQVSRIVRRKQWV